MHSVTLFYGKFLFQECTSCHTLLWYLSYIALGASPLHAGSLSLPKGCDQIEVLSDYIIKEAACNDMIVGKKNMEVKDTDKKI